jgi:hypothetical protein
MFCPVCGVEDRTRTQYCRGCGAELHSLRATIEQGEPLTRSSASAREEIGRAIAAKIDELHNAGDLQKVVHGILPQIEKFLETPAERRDSQIRGGVITSFVGLSLILFFLLLAVLTKTPEVMIAGGAGVLVLMIGLGIVVAALLTGPRSKPAKSRPPDRTLNTGEEIKAYIQPPSPPLVTEGTTRQLRDGIDKN